MFIVTRIRDYDMTSNWNVAVVMFSIPDSCNLSICKYRQKASIRQDIGDYNYSNGEGGNNVSKYLR